MGCCRLLFLKETSKTFFVPLQAKHFMERSTATIHTGHIADDSRAIASPLILSTTFERGDDGLSYPGNYVYSRYNTPNRHALEQKLAVMEAGMDCVTFSSGLTSIMAVFQSLGTGSHIILPDDVYFGVRHIIGVLYAQWNLSCSYVDMSNHGAVKDAILPHTKLIWMETPSNPRLKITDIAAIVSIAKPLRILTAVDNTWATPYFQLPLQMGVDIVMHATTKYLGGHSDILGGALIFGEPSETSAFIRNFQKMGGAVPAPFDCWLLCRSLSSFYARMPVHAANAQLLAEFLADHPAIEQVLYPGLPGDPFHTIAAKQMTQGFGGMLSILVKGGEPAALQLTQRLQLFKHATSLGGVESLVEHRRSIEGEVSQSPGNLLRVSVGIEDGKDLVEDFRAALASLA